MDINTLDTAIDAVDGISGPYEPGIAYSEHHYNFRIIFLRCTQCMLREAISGRGQREILKLFRFRGWNRQQRWSPVCPVCMKMKREGRS